MQVGPQQNEAGQLQLSGPGPVEAGSHHGAGQRRHGPPASHRLSQLSRRRTASVRRLFEKAHIRPNLRPLKQDVIGDVGNVLWVLMGSIAMVLLVACANVANLLLVRVEGRRQELAIRTASAPDAERIAADLLFESVVLGRGEPPRSRARLWRIARSGCDGAHRPAAHP